MTAPKAHELDNMSNYELIDKLIFDSGNASHYRKKLFERMAEKGTNASEGLLNGGLIKYRGVSSTGEFLGFRSSVTEHEHAPKHESATWIRYRSTVLDMIEGRKAYCDAAMECRRSGWDFIDPEGRMIKPPEQVQDFLETISMEVGMYGDLFASRKNLLKMIMDAWLRWAALQ
jgi:hypothetical protein